MKLGRRAPHPEATHPRLKLGPFLRPEALPPAPPIVDWLTKVGNWPMYANDRYGDCVWAMIGHAIEAYTTYGQGATVKVTDADVLKGYTDVTGFNPNDPSTDQGTVIQDALNYWRTIGVGGHKILAFAQVDHTDQAQVDAALNLFGHILLGINFPASAMTQFDAGQPWDAVAHDGGIEGGHAVDLGYDAATQRLKVVTWARVQDVTPAFWSRYVEEAWVAASPEWVTTTGGSPAGLDVAGLNAAFWELTGQPGPFPVTPTPTPPNPDPADVVFAAAFRTWEQHPRLFGSARLKAAGNAWLAAKPWL